MLLRPHVLLSRALSAVLAPTLALLGWFRLSKASNVHVEAYFSASRFTPMTCSDVKSFSRMTAWQLPFPRGEGIQQSPACTLQALARGNADSFSASHSSANAPNSSSVKANHFAKICYSGMAGAAQTCSSSCSGRNAARAPFATWEVWLQTCQYRHPRPWRYNMYRSNSKTRGGLVANPKLLPESNTHPTQAILSKTRLAYNMGGIHRVWPRLSANAGFARTPHSAGALKARMQCRHGNAHSGPSHHIGRHTVHISSPTMPPPTPLHIYNIYVYIYTHIHIHIIINISAWRLPTGMLARVCSSET